MTGYFILKNFPSAKNSWKRLQFHICFADFEIQMQNSQFGLRKTTNFKSQMRTIIFPPIILFAPVRAKFPPHVKIQGMRKTKYSCASHLVHALIQRHKFPHPNYTGHLSLRCPTMLAGFLTGKSLALFSRFDSAFREHILRSGRLSVFFAYLSKCGGYDG